jgi:hypothetical protein
MKVGALKGAIGTAKKIADWEALDTAIDEVVAEQRTFVAWWDKAVTPRRNAALVHAKKHERDMLSMADATAETGITQPQVSRWRKRLANESEYRRFLRSVSHGVMWTGHNDIANAWVNSGNDEWYTRDRELDLVRAALGGTIDLDPASCAAAQLRVQAKRFFSKADDGLKQHWLGTVFLNPPYSLIAEFATKLVAEYRAGRTTAAVMLTPANTSTRWFQKAGRSCSLLCLSNGRRVRFIDANDKLANPAQGSSFFYFGHGQRRLQLFAQTFSSVGSSWVPTQATQRSGS